MNIDDKDELSLEDALGDLTLDDALDFDEFGLTIEGEVGADMVGIDNINIEEQLPDEDTDLPDIYLMLENLILLEQVTGKCDEDYFSEFDVIPAYAYKGNKLQYVCHVEIVANHILSMQRLGLNVSIQRKGKSPIEFDTQEQLTLITRTIREDDKFDYFTDADISGYNE